MKAVVFKNRKISITDVPIPVLSKNEALVKIHLAGICSTDSVYPLQSFEKAFEHTMKKGNRKILINFND